MIERTVLDNLISMGERPLLRLARKSRPVKGTEHKNNLGYYLREYISGQRFRIILTRDDFAIVTEEQSKKKIIMDEFTYYKGDRRSSSRVSDFIVDYINDTVSSVLDSDGLVQMGSEYVVILHGVLYGGSYSKGTTNYSSRSHGEDYGVVITTGELLGLEEVKFALNYYTKQGKRVTDSKLLGGQETSISKDQVKQILNDLDNRVFPLLGNEILMKIGRETGLPVTEYKEVESLPHTPEMVTSYMKQYPVTKHLINEGGSGEISGLIFMDRETNVEYLYKKESSDES